MYEVKPTCQFAVLIQATFTSIFWLVPVYNVFTVIPSKINLPIKKFD